MKPKRVVSLGSVTLVLIVLLCLSSSLFAAQEVVISDIIQNPSKYYNLPVKIKGLVMNVAPSQYELQSGFYAIRDESEAIIEVKTNTLPAPGQTFVVEGIVTLKGETQIPYLRELTRSKGSIMPYLTIGVAIIVAILIIILLYVLFKPKATKPVYVEGRTRETTRPISPEDFKKFGVEKTVEVPAVLAQLEVLNGPKKGDKYILKRRNVIGRDQGDFVLGDPTISAEHAVIVFSAGKYSLVDKSLTNPTRINKDVAKDEQELKDNDEITMGAVGLRFNLL